MIKLFGRWSPRLVIAGSFRHPGDPLRSHSSQWYSDPQLTPLLHAALSLLHRHEVLRCTHQQDKQGSIVCRVLPLEESRPPFTLIDLSGRNDCCCCCC
jgi:hypothetical protein